MVSCNCFFSQNCKKIIMLNNLIKIYKYLLSFLKSKWELRDYPIVFNDKRNEGKNLMNSKRFELIPYKVSILGWFAMQGHGNNKEEAFGDLEKNLMNSKKRQICLVRVLMSQQNLPLTKRCQNTQLLHLYFSKK